MTDVTLAILAGGEGRRMGKPKAELRVGGKPILAYLLDRFQWAGPTLLVTAPGRERPPGAERFAREVTDPTGGEGPLRGVLTALDAVETETAVVTTCDMPLIERRHLGWIANELTGRIAAALVMLRRGAQLEPFPLAIRGTALPFLRERFNGGARSIRSIADVPGAVALRTPADWSDELWMNVNTPADLAALNELGRPSGRR